jgi:hypothetical protein
MIAPSRALAVGHRALGALGALGGLGRPRQIRRGR